MAPPLLALRDATAGLGDERLFRQVSVQVEAGARICLVGRNGSGKSTLLRALAGEVELDAGDRFVQPGVTVAYLPQEPRHDGAWSASDVVAGGLPADIGPAEGRHLAHAMLERLSVPPDAVLATLSGGEARRVAIGRCLISAADILLLDEPTNHLDIEMILRLEADLERLRAAIVLVSHDRAFLNALSRTTWWLDRGRLLQQERGYAEFDRWSDEVLAAEEEARAKLDRQIALETHWSHHGITARRKRNQGRLRRLDELRQARARRPAPEGRVNLPTVAGGQGAKLIVEASAISKGFHAGPLVDRFSTRILRGDRIGLVGPNGAGKTTLLRLLTGQLQPDAGEVRLAHDLEVAFVDQRRESLDPDATPWSTLCPAGGDHVMVQGRARHVVTYLKDFLFRPEQARAPLRSLSGGERNRLVLARQLARPVDLMVLDEPTNDLDLDTLDLLQEVLSDFKGTLLLVSHDRDFLDRLVTSVIAFEGQGRLVEYAGGYSDMLRQRRPSPPAAPGKAGPVEARKADRPDGRARRPERELERTIARIEQLERQIRDLEGELGDPGLFMQDPGGFEARTGRLEVLKQELSDAERRWLELETGLE